MAVTDQDFEKAEKRMADHRRTGHAVEARYDPATKRVVVLLDNGVQIAFPASLAEGLGTADTDQLSEIEISPTGLGLHWPQLDADIYVPDLMKGIFGSKGWMAAALGAAGGKASTPAKVAAARENGKKGGRPRRVAGG